MRNSRGGRIPFRDRSRPHVHRCRCARHHRAPSRRRASHHDRRRSRDREGTGAASRPVEYNIEGDPRPGFLELVLAVKPDQCTLVPVKPGEITSEAGWPADTPADVLSGMIGALQAANVRVSLFVDPEPKAIEWAKKMGADRVELYTEPFARAFERGPQAAAESFKKYSKRVAARVRSRRGRQRRPRSRFEKPHAVSHAAAPRRSLDRPRPDQPRDLRRPRQGGEGISGGVVGTAARGVVDDTAGGSGWTSGGIPIAGWHLARG